MSISFAFLGPESTGKSTASQEIAKRIQGVYISEYAREYYDHHPLIYSESTLDYIALMQIGLEHNAKDKYPECILLCDTELISIKIWMEFLGYTVPQWILANIESENYRHYFLMDIDLPWVADAQRENEKNRIEIFDLFIQNLNQYHKPYSIIRGFGEDRIQQILKKINTLI